MVALAAAPPRGLTLDGGTCRARVGQGRMRGAAEREGHEGCRIDSLSPLAGRHSQGIIMNKTLIALAAAVAATLSLGAYADTVTKSEANAQTTQAKGDYKADKAQAKADYNANKQDCRETTSGAVKRACKNDAKAQEKQDKADAKLDYKEQKADIKANTN